MSDLGRYLRHLRGKRSLREVAELTGLSHTYIYDIENGFRRGTKRQIKPSPETLKKLSEAYGESSYVELMVLAGYWPEDELIAPINWGEVKEQTAEYKTNLAADTTEARFDKALNDMELDEILRRFGLKLDGRELTEEEARGVIAYLRSVRSMK